MNTRTAWLGGLLVAAICASAQLLILLPFRHTLIQTQQDAMIVGASLGSSLWATLALGWGLWAFVRLQRGDAPKSREAILWWLFGLTPAVLGAAACLVLVLAWLS